ncbi:MAG: hypothetical protein AAF704_12235 [Cyanobacteria bacterium P01_D01_bin.123]
MWIAVKMLPVSLAIATIALVGPALSEAGAMKQLGNGERPLATTAMAAALYRSYN